MKDKFIRVFNPDSCSACGRENNAFIQVHGQYGGKVQHIANMCDSCFHKIYPELPTPVLDFKEKRKVKGQYKQIYVKKGEKELWEEAKHLSGLSYSATVALAIKQFIEKKKKTE